jgi:5-(carboxyamino)imidazole ribonucleotide mutase
MTGSKLVGIVMGSDSDLPIMKQAADVLHQFGIGYEMNIISAHRTPEKAVGYAASAEERGLEVIIAGAGAAAHLAGFMAGLTTLPVIGVPIKSAALNGMDSLLSIVQMPPGVPVATVAIDGARNAGILAAQIVANGHPEIREKLKQFKLDLAAQVEAKARKAGLLEE